MSSGRYMVDISLTNEGLNPILPHVVGAIEALDQATLMEIKKQTETDLNKRISDKDLEKALDNGMKLGILKMRREFKVCKEFTTREIKRLKYVEDNLWGDNKPQVLGTNEQKKQTLWDFVKYHRNQRKKKLTMKQKKQRTTINNRCGLGSDLSDYMCNKCRRSIERKRSERSRSRNDFYKEEAWDEDDSRSSDGSETESEASRATKKNPNKKNENKVTCKKEGQDKTPDEKSQGKSRLLVQKSPLETEPPYYDIFT